MKINLTKFFAVAGCFLLAGLALPATASHVQGSELTYICVAPNTYVATLKLYRDCYAIQSPASATMQIKSAGCNLGRGVSLNKMGTRLGTDYCAQSASPTCNATGPANYEETTYVGTFTFTAPETQCPDWKLTWTECCWQNISNVLYAQSNNNYAEAFLKLRASGTTGTGFSNSSPEFVSPLPLFLNQNQPTMLSSLALDPDGDSLVYSLQAVLSDANNPVQYAAFNPQNGLIFNPSNASQYATVAPADQQYSGTFPMPSYFVDWTQPSPRTAVKSFAIDALNGTLLFTTPPKIASSVPYASDKYAIAVQVDEYRKVNGTAIKIGSIRRTNMITIIDCGLNSNPVLTAPTANGQGITPGSVINLRPGTPLTFTFAAHDYNFNDVLTLESDAATLLPGATFTKTSGNQPTGTISWTPTAADARNQLYFFRIIIQDDACPVKGQRTETYAVRVSNNGGVTGISKDLTNQASFTAYPNPFSAEITFKVKQTQAQQQILIYNVLGQQIDQLKLNGSVNTEQEVVWQNASKFPAGQYVARFSNGNSQTLKINKLQ
ncbi:MAG TPA: T9SS type A sorting domain-containing protein [Adhaeribacter sp.]|nr:T9SS type A sorting domain-containing protein [Adhaeribacter sp.]